MKKKKITDGVNEKGWGQPCNICKGNTRCLNGCLYCYFLLNHQLRFKKIPKEKAKRQKLKVDNKKVLRNVRKRVKRQMFPTSHDIFNFMIIRTRIKLKKLLKAGNNVLIVTKGRVSCLKKLIEIFDKERYNQYKENIEFRITITSHKNHDIKFWEPKASSFMERLRCIQILQWKDFKTSISIEPYLTDPIKIIYSINAFGLISKINSIWIGKMNYLSRIKSDFYYQNNLSIVEKDDAEYYFKKQKKLISIQYILKLIRIYTNLPDDIRTKIIFKDSIFNFLQQNNYNIKSMKDFEKISHPFHLSRFLKEPKEVKV